MKKVLVITENTKLLNALSEILLLADYKVIPASNGKLGLEKALQDKPDIILCSTIMKGLDGFRILKMINQDHELSLIPFIFLGDLANQEELRKAMDMGADDYLPEPVDTTELLRAIEARLIKSDHEKLEYARIYNINALFNNNCKISMTDLVNQNSERRIYRKKETLYEEGDRQNHLYYIVKGKVKNFKRNEEGKELIVDIHHEGDFIGCHSLLGEVTSPDNAMAMTDVEVLLISKKDCLDVINNDSRLSKEFLSMFSKDVTERDMQLIQIAYDSARKRVADGLLLVGEKFNGSAGTPVVLDISRRDLAGLTGISKETVIRTLSDFKDEGLIDICDQKIIIQKADKLRALPN